MADTITLTLDLYTPARISTKPLGLIMGTANITSYSQTKTALSALTGMFLTSGLLRVCPNGISSNGYLVRWSKTDSAFRCYVPGAITVTPALAAAGAAVSITPPGSTVDYTNADAVAQTVIITGGTSTHAIVKRTSGAFTSDDIFTTNPIVVHLEVGDKLNVTYSAAGTWTKLPDAAVTATGSMVAAHAEAANSANIGTFDFIAMGQMG